MFRFSLALPPFFLPSEDSLFFARAKHALELVVDLSHDDLIKVGLRFAPNPSCPLLVILLDVFETLDVPV